VLGNSIYGGKTYNAREERSGWNLPMQDTPPHCAGGWTGAMRVPAPGGALTWQMIEPIRITDEICPHSITSPKSGVYVVDLRQNICCGRRSSRIRLVSRGRPDHPSCENPCKLHSYCVVPHHQRKHPCSGKLDVPVGWTETELAGIRHQFRQSRYLGGNIPSRIRKV